MKSDSSFKGVLRYSTSGRKKTRAEIADAIYAQFRYKCPRCNLNIYIPNSSDKKLCRNCGHYVYKDKKVEFKEKLEYARKNLRG